MIDPTCRTQRCLAIVLAHPNGIRSQAVAAALVDGTSVATASGMLARLFWRGLIDRRLEGNAYVYTPRPVKP